MEVGKTVLIVALLVIQAISYAQNAPNMQPASAVQFNTAMKRDVANDTSPSSTNDTSLSVCGESSPYTSPNDATEFFDALYVGRKFSVSVTGILKYYQEKLYFFVMF